MKAPIRRILLVEDHAPTRAIMARMVQARGFSVVGAGTLAEARECIRAGDIGFLICDLGLPDGNGCDLMAELSRHLGIKGVAITGFGMDDDIARSKQVGFVWHLTKPIQASDLDQVIELARTHLADAGPVQPSAGIRP